MKKIKKIINFILVLIALCLGSIVFSKTVSAIPAWNGGTTSGMPSCAISSGATGYFPQSIGASIAYCDDQDSAVRWGAVDTNTYYPNAAEYGPGTIYANVGDALQRDAEYKALQSAKRTYSGSDYRNVSVTLKSIGNGAVNVTPAAHNHTGITLDFNRDVLAFTSDEQDQQEAQLNRAKTAIKGWMQRKFNELGRERKPQPLLTHYDYHSDYSISINWMEGPKIATVGTGWGGSSYSVTRRWSSNSSGSNDFDGIMNAYIFNGGNSVLTSRERTGTFSVFDIQTASWLQNDHEGSHRGYNADGSGSPTLSQGTSAGYTLYAEAKNFYNFNTRLNASGGYVNMTSMSKNETQVFVNRSNNRANDEYIVGPFTVTYPHYANISYIKDITLETSGENGNTTLSYLSGQYQIITATGNAYPESGEKFWVRFNARTTKYPTSLTVKPTFEYTSYVASAYSRLEGTGTSSEGGSRIYMYRGYIITMNRWYEFSVGYQKKGPNVGAGWYCTGPGGGPYATEDDALNHNAGAHRPWGGWHCNGTIYYSEGTPTWNDASASLTIGYTLIQACIKMDTTDYEVDDEQEVRTVEGGNPDSGYTGATRAGKAQASRNVTVDLTMGIGGYTWVDGTAGKESQYNGKRGDSQDKAMSGVAVILHQRKPDGAESIKASTKTGSNGYYSFYGLNALYTYYVEFRYNGQYYQPTKYKSTSWINSSKGTDIKSDRANLNAKFAEIKSYPQNYSGGQVYTRTYLKSAGLIDDFGNPTGNNQYVNDCMMSSYTGNNVNGKNFEYYPIYNKFVIGNTINGVNKASPARDSSGNYINVYSMLYNGEYNNLYINQGYVLRETVDLALHKDIYSSNLEIKGRTETYKYNKNDGLSDEGFWDINTQISDAYLSNAYKNAKSQGATSSEKMYNQTDYTREIFKEDYNFKVNTNTYGSDILDRTGMTSAEDELRIYVTYKIVVRNQSDAISSQITELVDYFDKEYKLIESSNNVAREQKYKPYLGDRKGNKIKDVVTSSSSKYRATEKQTSYYNKTYITGFDDVLLDPDTGKELYIYITFRVNNDASGYVILDESTSDGNTRGNKVGDGDVQKDGNREITTPKQNIVEINGYKTYYGSRATSPNGEYKTGNVAGLVDIDSVPGNLTNIDGIPFENGQINSNTFEDDTSKGPNIRIRLNRTNVREINGTVFEDERTVTEKNAQIGDGTRGNDETGINGVTVQLIELFKDSSGNLITGSDGKPLEKEWRTMKSGDKTIQSFIIDNQAININRNYMVENDGQYCFKSFAPGNYIVRFIYGDGKESVLGTKATNYKTGETNQENNITEFLKRVDSSYKQRADSSNGYNSSNRENVGLNKKSYNGQDYKSTTYQIGVANGVGSYQNVSTGAYNYDFDAASTGLYSDAKDIYNRRLEVNSESQTLTNNIAEIESSFEYISPYYNSLGDNEKKTLIENFLTQFYDKTKMTAETGVISIELEYNRKEDGTKNDNYINVLNNIGNSNYSKNGYYEVKDVDFGLVQRPQSSLKLTKQIANVKVVLSNGNVLFDASAKASNVMWIEGQPAHGQDSLNTYTTDKNYRKENQNEKTVSGRSNLMKMPVVRTANNKGRIQLTVDAELMHGATLQVSYIITVANVGEVDYSDAKFYYMGVEDDQNRNIVKTKVDTIVDYVGAQLTNAGRETRNNQQFNASLNPDWEKVEKDTLISQGLINSRLGTSADKYTTIVKTKDNSSVVKELVPILVDATSAQIKGKWEQNPLKVLGTVSSTKSVTGVSLVLSQMISQDNSSDDLTYNNIAEIVKTSNISGRRMSYSVVGNQDPTQEPYEIDAATPQEIVMLPPFGQNTIYYVLSLIVGIILIVGLAMVILILRRKN